MRALGPVSALALIVSAGAVPVRAEPLTFEAALSRAASDAPDLRATALGVEAAEASVTAAGQLPDPRLAFGLDGFPVSGPAAGRFGEDSFTALRVGIEQDLPSRARRRAERNLAESAVGVAISNNAMASREVRIAAGLAWIDLYYAGRKLAALDDILATLEPLWDTVPAGVASGSDRPATVLEVARLKAVLDDRRTGLIAQSQTARAILTRWTGDPDPSVEGSPPQDAPEPVILRAGLDDLPELKAYGARDRQAQAEIDLARAGARPDWSLQASYQRRDPRFGDMLSLGASVSLPLFQRERQQPIIAARTADAARVAVERDGKRRQLQAELEGDLAQHATDHARWMRARDVILPLALHQSDLETAAYAAGRVGLAEVIQTFTAVAEARLDVLDKEAVVTRHAAEISLTYGGGQ